MSLGGPRSRAEVVPFVSDLTGKKGGLAMAQSVAGRYAAIGGSSPLPAITEKLAHALTFCLDEATRVEAAFLYSHLTIDEAVWDCASSHVPVIAFLVLSPFYTTTTTGAFIKAAEEVLSRFSDSYRPVTTFIHSWFAQPPFIDWWVSQLREAVRDAADAFFLFSAHSMPVAAEHDLYRSQVKEAVELVAVKAGLSSYTLAWQSIPERTAEPWAGPSVEETLDSLADQGMVSVTQVPIGFLIDNLETLYDIDIVHRRHAEDLGLRYRRLACPNTHPLFVQALSEILSDSLREFHS
jgi:protoporphyrin/coproporphyrin ferrochelatase